MYLAPLTSSSNDRIVAAIVTTLLLSAMMTALHLMDVPDIKQKTNIYEEINWTRFRPKPKKIVPASEPVPVKVETPEKIQLPETTPAQPVQKIDLSALRTQFEQSDRSLPNLDRQNSSKTLPSQTNASPKIELKTAASLQGLNTLLGKSAQKLKINRGASNGRGGDAAPALKAGSGSLRPGKERYLGAGGVRLGGPEGKKSETAVEIGMLDFAKMGGSFDDLSPIYRPLIAWMKRNPARFDEVLNRFMEESDGDLTSMVSFTMNGRQFDLFLLCKEALSEVRVVLLEENESIYLIDKGFKESSSFLRIGSVNRTDTGEILSFGTTRRAAADSRTAQFYQIFLSWWESVK